MVVSKRDSLCMSILRSKYKVKDDWLRSNSSKQVSPIWKAIEKSKGIISKGACYLIGDSRSVEVWLDPWVLGIQGFIPSPRTGSPAPPPLKVSNLIDPELYCWTAPLIRDLFTQADAQAILSIPIPIRPRPDRMEWIPDSKGCFLVKAAYKEIASHNFPLPATSINWSLLWKLKAPERIKMLLWRVGTNSLPTKDNLLIRMEVVNPWCILCNQEPESAGHLFFNYPAARAIWFAFCWGYRLDQTPLNSHSNIISLILNPPEAWRLFAKPKISGLFPLPWLSL